MLDNIILEDIQTAVNEYVKLKAENAKSDSISQDVLDDKLSEIGGIISLCVYQATGWNQYHLDKHAVAQLGGKYYAVRLSGNTPVLTITIDEIDEDEVRITEPREE